MARIEHPKSPIPRQLKGLHLFHFDSAPCAQRVRFALGEKGLSRGREEKFDDISATAVASDEGHWVSRIVSLPKKQHMTQVYAGIHSNMVVPALVHDGQLYLESMDIIQYIDEAFSGLGPRLLPKNQTQRRSALERVSQAKVLHRSVRYVSFHWGLGKLAMLNTSKRRELAQLAKEGKDEEQLVDFYNKYSVNNISSNIYQDNLRKLYHAFNDVDRELTDGRKFLISDDISIADAFWSMKVLKLIETGYPIAEHHPTLYQWYQRVCCRPSFQNEVMSHNKGMNRFFRAKSFLQNLCGKGLNSAVSQVVHAA